MNNLQSCKLLCEMVCYVLECLNNLIQTSKTERLLIQFGLNLIKMYTLFWAVSECINAIAEATEVIFSNWLKLLTL